MKAIILSALSAIIATIGLAAPASATGFSLGGNSAHSSGGYSRIGIKDGKFFIEGESYFCHQSNSAMNMSFGNNVNVPQSNVPATNTSSCNAGQVINNPPANTTVTVNGVCGDAAEIAKIKASNANLIINSVGPCPTDGSKPATPATIIVKEKETVVKTVSAATGNGDTAVTLPETGIDAMPLMAAGLAVLAYGGTMAVRAFRG